MKNQPALQAVVVPLESQQPNAASIQLALFNEDGSPFTPGGTSDVPEATQEVSGTVLQGAPTSPSAAATLEDLVMDFNSLVEALTNAGILAPLPGPE